MDVLPDVLGDGGGGGDGSSGNNSDADDGGPAGMYTVYYYALCNESKLSDLELSLSLGWALSVCLSEVSVL